MPRFGVSIFPTDDSIQCDGWRPIRPRGGLEKGTQSLRKAAARAGRNFDALDKTVFELR